MTQSLVPTTSEHLHYGERDSKSSKIRRLTAKSCICTIQSLNNQRIVHVLLRRAHKTHTKETDIVR